jgi:hypothetical protein
VEDNGAESACRGIANTACTRCTEAINTRYREEMGLLLLLFEWWCLLMWKVIHACRRKIVQQLNWAEEELCSEWTWCTEDKLQKNRQRK